LLTLVVLKSASCYPWTLGLMAYRGQYTTSWQLVLAFITLTIPPAILIFLLAQRYIVAGLTADAVKAPKRAASHSTRAPRARRGDSQRASTDDRS
jgi:ABC-type maltose transport system permease subunit